MLSCDCLEGNISLLMLYCMLWCLPTVRIWLVHADKHHVPDHSASTVDHH